MQKIDGISSVRPAEPVLPYSPNTPLSNTPSTFIPSGIAPSDFVLSKPSIAHPNELKQEFKTVISVIYKFLETVQSIERGYLKTLDLVMDQTHEATSKHIEKEVEYLHEVQEANKETDFWDFLRKVAACLLGAASIVIGATLLGPGASLLGIVAGSAMILSGGISVLGNTLFDMQSNPQVATALMVAGGGLSLVGGVAAAAMGIGSLTSLLGKVAIAGLSVASSGSEIMKECYQWQLDNKKASYTKVQEANQVARIEYNSMRDEMGAYTKTVADLTETCIIAANKDKEAVRKITALSGPLTAA